MIKLNNGRSRGFRIVDTFSVVVEYIDIQMSYCSVPFPNPFSSGRVTPLLGRFSELEVLLSNMNVQPGSIDAVLLDAGCSSMQMDQAERGFSLSKDGPLDMRMDGER